MEDCPGYRWPPFRRENFAGADVWRAPIWVPKSPGGIKRTLHLLSFALTSFPLILMQLPWRPDVVLKGKSRAGLLYEGPDAAEDAVVH